FQPDAKYVVRTPCSKTDWPRSSAAKLIKDEHEDHVTECHGPGGTASWPPTPDPLPVFPGHQKPISAHTAASSTGCASTFVALWHSLNTQPGQRLGSYIRPRLRSFSWRRRPGVKSQLTTGCCWTSRLRDGSAVLICSSSPSRGSCSAHFKALVTGAAPFHRERGRDEWRWLNLVRLLHLMGTWLTELRTSPGGNRSQREDFCELVFHGCNEYDELFQLLNRGLWRLRHAAHGRVSGRGSGAIFPLTKEAGHDRDLLVMELYATKVAEVSKNAPCELGHLSCFKDPLVQSWLHHQTERVRCQQLRPADFADDYNCGSHDERSSRTLRRLVRVGGFLVGKWPGRRRGPQSSRTMKAFSNRGLCENKFSQLMQPEGSTAGKSDRRSDKGRVSAATLSRFERGLCQGVPEDSGAPAGG
uniref:RUN domain-containing protein n=1 Tax=Macrostomum lignano TaxID=282301 RepID=A0A1I8FGG2_9PLAT